MTIEQRAHGRGGLGPDQERWLDRIETAGGLVKMDIEVLPVLKIVLGNGEEIRVPIRIFESLKRRELFEEIDVDGNPHYRLRDEFKLYDL